MELQERVIPLMTVTESAAAKIKQLMAEEEDVNVLRVAIQGGGCSGFQYGLGFDRGAATPDPRTLYLLREETVAWQRVNLLGLSVPEAG